MNGNLGSVTSNMELKKNGQTGHNLPQIIPQRTPSLSLSLRNPSLLSSSAPGPSYMADSPVPLQHLPPPPPLLKIPNPSISVPRFDAIPGPSRMSFCPDSNHQPPLRNLEPLLDNPNPFNDYTPSSNLRNLLLSPSSSSVTSETSPASASLSPTSVCSLPVTIPHELSSQTSTETDASELSNAAKCKWYRERDKQKRKNMDLELQYLQNKNEYLKAKNDKLTKNVNRLKEVYLELLAKRKAERKRKKREQEQSSSESVSSEASSLEPMAIVKAEVAEIDAEDIVVKEEFNI